MNKKQLLGLISVAGSLTALTLSAPAANAFTWTVNATTAGGTSITGTFVIDDEAVNNDLTSITSSSITVGAVTYSTPNTVGITAGLFTSIQWLNGTNVLTLNFQSPLTTGGGTVALNPTNSLVIQPADVPVFPLGNNAISGSVSAPSIIPFNFSTTPGLVVLGLITGVAKGRKHLPKIKEKLKELLTKK